MQHIILLQLNDYEGGQKKGNHMKVLARILAGALFVTIMLAMIGCSQPSANVKQRASEDITIVHTQQGDVQGMNDQGILAFKGIPFAEPPVGDLRFAPPQKVSAWEGVLACTDYRDWAMQMDGEDVIGSEDCLYLNVWTPENAQGKNLPVYVYIHGGAFAMGSPSKDMYDGTRFAQDGVIQVNLSYRLNGLGFFASEELEKEYGYLGNIGVLDQIAGLQWVQDNIAAFGGDPNNVTIGGESAGSFSVSNLIESPFAKGLFDRAIMESGNLLGQPLGLPTQPGDRESALQVSTDLMGELAAKDIQEMRALDAAAITKASAFNLDMSDPSPYYQWPVFDGVVLPADPYEALTSSNVNEVPILAGFNTDEGSMFIPEGISEQTYTEYVERIFGDRSAGVLERYPVDADHSATDRARYLFKMSLMMGSEVFADELSKQGHDVYFYEFALTIPELEKIGLGTMHAIELPFVFDTIPDTVSLDDDTAAFKEAVHTYWLNFIKTGDPNSEGLAPWPKYSNEAKLKLVLDEQMKSASVDDVDEVAYFTNLFWS